MNKRYCAKQKILREQKNIARTKKSPEDQGTGKRALRPAHGGLSGSDVCYATGNQKQAKVTFDHEQVGGRGEKGGGHPKRLKKKCAN